MDQDTFEARAVEEMQKYLASVPKTATGEAAADATTEMGMPNWLKTVLQMATPYAVRPCLTALAKGSSVNEVHDQIDIWTMYNPRVTG